MSMMSIPSGTYPSALTVALEKRILKDKEVDKK